MKVLDTRTNATYFILEELLRRFDSDDEETAKKGRIGLVFKLKDFRFKNQDVIRGYRDLNRFGTDLPICIDAYHKFMEAEPGFMDKFVAFCLRLMLPEVQARTKIHYGKSIAMTCYPTPNFLPYYTF